MTMTRRLSIALTLFLLCAGVLAAGAIGNSTGTWCYTHECQMASLDSGPPYLTHDGDKDADDSAGQTGSIQHVILIMEENHSRSQVTASSMPYLTSLANTYAQATDYHSVSLPSLPNYIALTSGGLQGFAGTDCSPSAKCQTSADNIFHQAGSAWRVWAESMPSHCDKSGSGEYAPRHTAAPYYTDLSNCSTNDVAYPSTPGWTGVKFILVAPNLCNDAHDCSLGTADAWLKSHVPKLMANPLYQDGSTLIEITFDSGGPTNNVEMVFVNPALHSQTLTGTYTHYSLLRLNEELLGFPLLGSAAGANDMRSGLGL